MTLAQALAVAAAALVVAAGPQSGALVSAAHAQVAEAMDRASIRAAVSELADLMERNYVFPDAARQYADHLRTRAAAGSYDGLSDPEQLADTLETELNAVHADAHLRISLSQPATTASGPRVRHGPPGGGQAISDAMWLADGVGYFRVNGLPSTDESVGQMTAALDRLEDAQTLIIDLRRCPGGGLREMDVLFSRLYAEPTRVMIMDTRSDAASPLDGDDRARLRRVSAPAGITRDEHWAMPTAPVNSLSDARVFVLTGRTGSACQHLSQALRETGRATLVGTRTGGAGHYGGQRRFGGGRFQIFLPVGNSYAPGAQSWETVGVLPHRDVAMEEALNEALREIDVPVSAAAAVPPFPALRRVVETSGSTRRYGIVMLPLRAGATYVLVDDTAENSIARAAGLRANDRIVAINGTAVAQMSTEQFGAAMRTSPMTLAVERGSERVELRMSLD
ncbi:MAG TPA: S41 family peptidase [Candidatus Binatia bacterium]|nr:S41 family peptidase [Candidatus Binatia bacterium]